MRLFIAARIPTDTQDQVGDFMEQFFKLPGRVKWVEPHNIHITLKFLGETAPELLESVQSSIRVAATGFGPFDVTLRNCGTFPNPRAPRVFWVGINDPEMRLAAIAATLDRETTQLGFESEKRAFSPHLTLGRVKEPERLEALKAAFARTSFGPVPVHVDAIHLIESHLRPSGPIYKDLAEFKL